MKDFILRLEADTHHKSINGNLTEDQLFTLIEDLFGSRSGRLTMEPVDPPGIGIQACEVMFENGKYVINALTHNEVDSESLTYYNAKSDGGTSEILGEVWSNSIVCEDKDIAIAAFKQFYSTGQISKDLLD